MDLGGGAFPVFGGEGVEGEVADAAVTGGLDDGADGLDAAAMALDAGEPAFLGPAAVAIHDDGDVGGRLGGGGFHAEEERRNCAKPMEIRSTIETAARRERHGARRPVCAVMHPVVRFCGGRGERACRTQLCPEDGVARCKPNMPFTYTADGRLLRFA